MNSNEYIEWLKYTRSELMEQFKQIGAEAEPILGSVKPHGGGKLLILAHPNDENAYYPEEFEYPYREI